MATFCSKCGAAISPGAQSCSSCGTAVVAAAPIAQPMVAPVAAPAKSGGALKIILIIVAVFVGLGVLAMGAVGYIGYRVAHTIKVSKNGEQVAINVPGGGSFSASTSENIKASDLGTEIYPGATSGKAAARMSTPSGSWISAVYVTSDSQDKVVAYYKEKLGDQVSTMESSGGAILTVKKGENESVMVTITPSSENSGKTQIAIVHTTSTKSS